MPGNGAERAKAELGSSLKTFVIGVVLPGGWLFVAIPYLIGRDKRGWKRGEQLTDSQAVGDGLAFLGLAFCTHALAFGPYDNRPKTRIGLFLLGVGCLGVGCWLRFRSVG